MTNKLVAPELSHPLSLFRHGAVLLLLAILTTNSWNSYAVTLDDLIAANELTLDIHIKPQAQHIVGQPVIIAIEIASNRWFAKGTQVKDFTLADTIILANSELSINGTKRVGNQTWSTQTREITLYPRRPGQFTLPEIAIRISISTEHDGIIEGVLTTEPKSFTIVLPAALVDIEHFIVSPKVAVKISPSLDGKKVYSLGDAISVNVAISTQDSPAMMIPPLKQPQINGISIYQKTPQVIDKSNRGELIGTRIESFTYIFEQAGEYQIAEQKIFWWNTRTKTLEKIIIPSLTFKVGASTVRHSSTNIDRFNVDINKVLWLTLLITLTASLIIGLYHYRNTLLSCYARIVHVEQRNAKKAFLRAVCVGNYIDAVNQLKKYSLLIKVKPNQLPSTQALTLNKLAFDKNSQISAFSVDDAKQLLTALTRPIPPASNELEVQTRIKLNNE